MSLFGEITVTGVGLAGSEKALILALAVGGALGVGLGWFTFPYLFPLFQNSGLAIWAGAGGSFAAAYGAFYAGRSALRMAEESRLREEKERLEIAKQVVCFKVYQYTSIVAEIDWMIRSRSGIGLCPDTKTPFSLEMPGEISLFGEWLEWLERVDMTNAYLLSSKLGQRIFLLTERVNFLSRFSGPSKHKSVYIVPLTQLLQVRFLAQNLSYGLNELMNGSANWEEVVNGQGFEFPSPSWETESQGSVPNATEEK